jgi:hypothetical protein
MSKVKPPDRRTGFVLSRAERETVVKALALLQDLREARIHMPEALKAKVDVLGVMVATAELLTLPQLDGLITRLRSST